MNEPGRPCWEHALGSPYCPPNAAVVAALNTPQTTVMDCNANMTEKLLHVVEHLTVKLDDL